MVTLPRSKFTLRSLLAPNSIYTIKCNPLWGMQVAHRGLIKNLTIPRQGNRITNMAASVHQVPVAVESHRFLASGVCA